mmetsp:Transcript_98867/g.280063  ORF Transcript_98867/g.280063 Transcript_98867/m.280063 type:complete len:205 (+) Transcript_98867:944-1558(+)
MGLGQAACCRDGALRTNGAYLLHPSVGQLAPVELPWECMTGAPPDAGPACGGPSVDCAWGLATQPWLGRPPRRRGCHGRDGAIGGVEAAVGADWAAPLHHAVGGLAGVLSTEVFPAGCPHYVGLACACGSIQVASRIALRLLHWLRCHCWPSSAGCRRRRRRCRGRCALVRGARVAVRAGLRGGGCRRAKRTGGVTRRVGPRCR